MAENGHIKSSLCLISSNLFVISVVYACIFIYPFISFFLYCRRFCVCVLHEQFVRYLNALQKSTKVAHHSSNCACECAFCDACEEIDRFKQYLIFHKHILETPKSN